MSGSHVSTFRAVWLIGTFALRRTTNRLGSIFGRKKPAIANAKRRATGRKRPAATALLFVFTLALLYNGVAISSRLVQQVAALTEARDGVTLVDRTTSRWIAWVARQPIRARDVCLAPEEETSANDRATYCKGDWLQLRGAFLSEARQANRIGGPSSADELLRVLKERGPSAFRERKVPAVGLLPSTRLWSSSAEMTGPLGIVALLLSIALTLLIIVGQQDLAKPESTLEWWLTFPVSTRGLILARILEAAVVSPFTWSTLFPLFSVVFWCAGFAWKGIALGLFATLYVGCLAGSARVFVETSLRRFFSLRVVARIQALILVLAMPPFFVAVLASSSPDLLAAIVRYAHTAPRWIFVNATTPIGIAEGGASAFGTALGCTLFAAGVVTCATFGGAWMIRDGLVTTTGPHQGTRRRAVVAAEGVSSRWSFGSKSVMQKELRFVSRNGTVLMQIFVVPLMIVGMQLLMNRGLLRVLGANPHHASAMTFSVTAFVLATGGCGTLAVEVPTLWLYFTLPRTLERVLVDKAIFWSIVASGVGVAVFLVLHFVAGAPFIEALPTMLLAFVGIALYAFIATAIGALATDPHATEVRRRMQPAMVYLFMILAAMFSYAIYTPSWWAKFAQLVLSALLAFALWEKVRDHVPYLLDPTEAPPPSIGVSDGVIAVLAFFVLQGILGLLFGVFDFSPGVSLLFAFAGAGLIVTASALLIFWSSGVPTLFARLGLGAPAMGVLKSIALGIAGGIVAAVVARGYLLIVAHVPMLRALQEETTGLAPTDEARAILRSYVALAVIAAPLFEEFIFRAVLYGGFRRSFRPLYAALASALIFAIVHPVIAFAPVFVMGLIAALVYERARFLPASIATHMTYNAIVVLAAMPR